MNCQNLDEILSDLMDGALPRGQTGEANAHLKACARCRRQLEEMRALVSQVRELAPVPLPAGFVGSVLGRIEARQTRRPQPWRWLVLAPAAAAAALVFYLAIGPQARQEFASRPTTLQEAPRTALSHRAAPSGLKIARAPAAGKDQERRLKSSLARSSEAPGPDAQRIALLPASPSQPPATAPRSAKPADFRGLTRRATLRDELDATKAKPAPAAAPPSEKKDRFAPSSAPPTQLPPRASASGESFARAAPKAERDAARIASGPRQGRDAYALYKTGKATSSQTPSARPEIRSGLGGGAPPPAAPKAERGPYFAYKLPKATPPASAGQAPELSDVRAAAAPRDMGLSLRGGQMAGRTQVRLVAAPDDTVQVQISNAAPLTQARIVVASEAGGSGGTSVINLGDLPAGGERTVPLRGLRSRRVRLELQSQEGSQGSYLLFRPSRFPSAQQALPPTGETKAVLQHVSDNWRVPVLAEEPLRKRVSIQNAPRPDALLSQIASQSNQSVFPGRGNARTLANNAAVAPPGKSKEQPSAAPQGKVGEQRPTMRWKAGEERPRSLPWEKKKKEDPPADAPR